MNPAFRDVDATPKLGEVELIRRPRLSMARGYR